MGGDCVAETLKDYLIGVKFNVDSSGAGKANQAVSELDNITRQLGEVLMQVAAAFQAMINQMQGGKGTVDETAVSMENGAESAGQMEQALRKANNEGKLSNLKQGRHNVNEMSRAMKKASSTLKRFAKMAVGYLIGSNVVNAFKSVMEFNEGLAASAKKLGKTIEQTRAYNLALQVMGKTAKEIEQDASLKTTFKDLQKIGESLALPQAAAGLNNIGAIKNSLLELKMVGSYALQWIYYKAQEVAAGPLAETRKILGDIRGWMTGNIQNIAAGIAKAFSWVVQIINSVAIAVGKVLGWIDRLPPAIKLAGAAAIAVILAVISKTALITMIIGAILLLIDDFVTYMEGGESLFGDFWGACIEWINKISPAIDAAVAWIDELIQKIAVIIGGIIEGFKSFWNTLEDNGTLLKLQGIFEDVFSVVQGVIDTVIRWFSNLFTGIENGGERSKSAFSYMCDAIAGVIDIVATVIGWVTDLVTKILEVPGVMETINGAVDLLTAMITGAWEIINGVIQAIIALLKGDFSGAWEAISTAASGAWDLIMSTADGLCDGLITLFNSISQFFSDLFAGLPAFASQAWENIKSAFFAVGAWFTTNVVEPIKGAFSGIGEWFSSTFSEAWKAVEDVFGKVGEWAAGIWNGIVGGIQNAVDWVSNAAKDAGSWITQAGVDVGDFLKDGWQNGWGLWGNSEQNEPIAVEVDTEQVEEAQTAVEAFEAALAGIANNGTLDTWYEEQFNSIVNTVQQGADKVDEIISLCRTAIEELSPAALSSFEIVVNSFSGIRNSITKSMSASARAVSRSVASIKASLASIPKNISVNIGANVVTGYQSALATLGGSGAATPSALLSGIASKITNNSSSNTVTAPATFNVYGIDAKSAATQAAKINANLVLRNVKSTIQ